MKALNRIVLVVGYAVIAFSLADFILSFPRSAHTLISPAGSRIWAGEAIAEAHTPRSPHGDGQPVVVWWVLSSPEDVRDIVSRDRVHQGRIWFAGPLDERARAAIDFVRQGEGFGHVATQPDLLRGRRNLMYRLRGAT